MKRALLRRLAAAALILGLLACAGILFVNACVFESTAARLLTPEAAAELEDVNRRGAPPVVCLSMPDASTVVLAYLTYCPTAPQNMW